MVCAARNLLPKRAAAVNTLTASCSCMPSSSSSACRLASSKRETPRSFTVCMLADKSKISTASARLPPMVAGRISASASSATINNCSHRSSRFCSFSKGLLCCARSCVFRHKSRLGTGTRLARVFSIYSAITGKTPKKAHVPAGFSHSILPFPLFPQAISPARLSSRSICSSKAASGTVKRCATPCVRQKAAACAT